MRASAGLRRFVWLCLPLFSLAVLAAGCGSEGTVSGTIYYKGQPLKGGTIRFFPEGKDSNVAGIIGMDGTYSVAKIPPGKTKIAVVGGTQGVPASVFRQMGGQNAEKGLKQMGRIGRAASGTTDSGDDADKGKGKDEVPKEDITALQKFADPEKSGLTLDVTGGKQPHDIHLD
jgi:hypothetical protein